MVTALPGGLSSQTEPVTVERCVPDMDYVVESGNRLWGCKYGIVDGQAVNAVYASKLGDFRNWNCFAGLSTDSYAAPGAPTGSSPGRRTIWEVRCFSRKTAWSGCIPAPTGHQIVTVQCPGVKDGSGGSLQVVDGKLYYHSQGGVCVFDGSMPVNVSQALGRRGIMTPWPGRRRGATISPPPTRRGRGTCWCWTPGRAFGTGRTAWRPGLCSLGRRPVLPDGRGAAAGHEGRRGDP